MINLNRKLGRVNIDLKANYVGEDLIIIISGGDRPHVGAISYGGEGFSNKDFEKNTVVYGNHKEYIISQKFSQSIGDIFKGNYMISVGIHLDDITKEEIKIVMKLSEELIEEITFIIKGE